MIDKKTFDDLHSFFSRLDESIAQLDTVPDSSKEAVIENHFQVLGLVYDIRLIEL